MKKQVFLKKLSTKEIYQGPRQTFDHTQRIAIPVRRMKTVIMVHDLYVSDLVGGLRREHIFFVKKQMRHHLNRIVIFLRPGEDLYLLHLCNQVSNNN